MGRRNRYTAFAGTRAIISGSRGRVARAVWEEVDRGEVETILVFEDESGRAVDFDLRGGPEEVEARYAEEVTAPDSAGTDGPRRRGRPKLGVVGKEVTLLPRHWAWLAAQRGGASATLRRLVDEARQAGEAHGVARRAQDAAYRFMSAMCGNEPGFEEAVRALYGGDGRRFEAESDGWPEDVRDHARHLAGPALQHLERSGEAAGGAGR